MAKEKTEVDGDSMKKAVSGKNEMISGGDGGKRDSSRLSLEDQENLSEKIRHIQGILELIYCALSSENPISSDGVLTVVMDAQHKMEEIEKAVEVLAAA